MSEPTLEAHGEDAYSAVYEFHRFRFLLDDGRVIDVEAIADDAYLRGVVLSATKAKRIAGVAGPLVEAER